MAIEKKNQNSGGRFGAASWIALPIQPIYLIKWAKWAELAVLFGWWLRDGPQDFDFFGCHRCRLLI
jgi:hypothetical protein